jgi:hypothetical protein
MPNPFHRPVERRQLFFAGLLVILAIVLPVIARPGGGTNAAAPATVASKPLSAALPPERWQQVENSVDRALAWIASEQAPDGSFPTLPAGQPAVTSLCVMAFLSRGHQPGLGPYGRQLDRAIDFVMACQRPDGLFSQEPPGPTHVDDRPAHTAVYNHAISGLMLGEIYGHAGRQKEKDVKQAIEKALQFTRDLQTRPKDHPGDRGGWRYLRLRYDHNAPDSDLSVTAWQLMFLRSARNAEFSVPQEYIDDGIGFVRRCWDERISMFHYQLEADGSGGAGLSRGLVGAGILSLSLAGQHQTPIALAAGNWLLAHPYRRFGELVGDYDHFFFSAYYCSQAAAQLGGQYWESTFPPLVNALLSGQARDGSWPPEIGSEDSMFGNSYTTALAVLALTPPYQLLPIYQR